MTSSQQPIYFEQIHLPHAHDWRQIHAIYQGAFPEGTRIPFPAVIEAISRGEFTLIAARVDQRRVGSVVGFVLLARLPGTSTLFMPYMAVDPDWSGQGVGTRLYRYTVYYASRQPGIDELLWEVSALPDGGTTCADPVVSFYTRLGGHLVGEAPHYCIPNQAGDGTIPLRLMWAPVGDHPDTPPGSTRIASWITAIYQIAFPEYESLGAELIASIVS